MHLCIVPYYSFLPTIHVLKNNPRNIAFALLILAPPPLSDE